MNISSDKGKAVAGSAPETAQGESEATQPSLIARVADSAKGLVQNTISAPGSGRDLDAAISSSGKASSSGTTGRHLEIGESSHSLPASGRQVGQEYSGSGLRSNHAAEHVVAAEKDFSRFLDGIDTFQSSAPHGGQESSTAFEEVWSKGGESHSNVNVSRTVAEQERRDGEDVVNLLTSSQSGEVFEAEDDDYEYGTLDWGLDQNQIVQLQAITRELFPLFEPHGQIEKENPQNLHPHADHITVSLLSGSSRIDQSWSEQWESVLTRYTDEVWGGLLPLVKEARQELADVKSDIPPKEVPDAVRRLEAILGHLQRR